jgi:hypothetical protein
LAKKAHFFSHDLNARHDPKMTAMRGIYGAEGYGWFWLLIEMMAEADEYKLDMQSKYSFNAYAVQLQCKKDEAELFVNDCINEFELFDSDGLSFWSKTLQRRMQYRDKVSETRTNAANAKWEKQRANANGMHMHSTSNASVMQKDANETKQNNTLKHSPEFDEFWSVYPRKIAKTDAWKKWQRRIKEGVDPDYMIDCAENYAIKCKGKEESYIKHPATFLNEERYKDYEDKPKIINYPTAEERLRRDEERPNERPLWADASGFGGDT